MLIFLSMLESDAERQLFLELYNQYGNAMLRVAQRYFPKSQQDAEDAVQNAWLKAVQNFSKILEVSCKKRGAYLVIIVRNKAITILRKRKEELPREDAFADETAAFGDGDGKSIIEIIQTNQNDQISITLTLKQGTTTVDSWSTSDTGSAVIPETCTVKVGKTTPWFWPEPLMV